MMGKTTKEMQSVTCAYCGFMWSRADHERCPNCKPEHDAVIITGTAAEEVKTLGQYRDDIIEAAVALEPSGTSTDLSAAVDAYHKALREQAREE